MLRPLVLFLAVAGALLLTGCESLIQEVPEKTTGHAPAPAAHPNAERAEVTINAFLSDLGDEDFRSACRDGLTLRFQLLLAAQYGSCEQLFEGIVEEGDSFNGSTAVTVLDSRHTEQGLWVRTTNGRYLLQGNRIAFLKES